jgi:hypothetical protein
MLFKMTTYIYGVATLKLSALHILSYLCPAIICLLSSLWQTSLMEVLMFNEQLNVW